MILALMLELMFGLFNNCYICIVESRSVCMVLNSFTLFAFVYICIRCLRYNLCIFCQIIKIKNTFKNSKSEIKVNITSYFIFKISSAVDLLQWQPLRLVTVRYCMTSPLCLRR